MARPVVRKVAAKRTRPVAPEVLDIMASRFRMLGEPARLKILHALQSGELSVSELIERTELSQANTSKHLALLAAAGMVGRRKEGANAYYSITDPVVFEVCDLVCNRLLA